jgi:hypothetical protein
LNHFTNPFLWRVFQDRVSRTICLGWLRTTILLISTSWVVGITGVSHQHLDELYIFNWWFLYISVFLKEHF